MPIDRTDPEIRAFVAASTARTYAEMAADCLARFGPDRAWPVELIAEVRRQVRPPVPGGGSRYEADTEVMAFIADRADLWTLDKLLAAGRVKFGSRFPARSQLHRIIGKMRRRAWAEKSPLGGREGRDGP